MYPITIQTSLVTKETSHYPSDGQLFKIATDGYSEVEKLWASEDFARNNQPNVMAALAVDNQVFLASSIKGRSAGKYTYDDCGDEQDQGKLSDNLKTVPEAEELVGALENCMNEMETSSHANNAQCGEIMAIYTWLLSHPGKTLRRRNNQNQGHIVAVDKSGIKPPCTKENMIGCKDVISEKGMSFHEVKHGSEPEDYESIFMKVGGQQELAKKVVPSQVKGEKGGKREVAFEA